MKLSTKELLQAVKTLAFLVKRDYPLDQAVKGIDPSTGPWLEVGEHLASGDDLGTALRRYPNLFSPFFTSMLESAEKSENSGKILTTLSNWLETCEQLRNEVLTALTYPTLLLACLFLECGILLTYGLPEVVFPMLYAPENLLPPDWLKSVSTIFGVISLIFSVTLMVATRKLEKLVPYLHHLTPFRFLVIRSDLSLWARGVAAFLQAGKPLDQALDHCWNVAWDQPLRNELKELGERIRQGNSLSQAISKMDLMDPGLRWAVNAGESREDLSATLLLGAERLEQNLWKRCRIFLTVLQPVAVAAVGLMTALVLLPFWWSMYHFSENFSL